MPLENAGFGDRHPPLTDHTFPWEDLGSQVARAGLVCTRNRKLRRSAQAEFVRNSPAHLPKHLIFSKGLGEARRKVHS